MSENVYRHLPDWRVKRAYRKALRTYSRMRSQALYNLAEEYMKEAERLADEIDRRTNNG